VLIRIVLLYQNRHANLWGRTESSRNLHTLIQLFHRPDARSRCSTKKSLKYSILLSLSASLRTSEIDFVQRRCATWRELTNYRTMRVLFYESVPFCRAARLADFIDVCRAPFTASTRGARPRSGANWHRRRNGHVASCFVARVHDGWPADSSSSDTYKVRCRTNTDQWRSQWDCP